ncbi:hypothetical protein Syun_021984 [Stephania yunnanensis]|uniref:Uncharacterized protein n=1 Tax=Stephania yunnanensis TaxID=152371 RepID=A0AAP0IIK1_9MAGN
MTETTRRDDERLRDYGETRDKRETREAGEWVSGWNLNLRRQRMSDAERLSNASLIQRLEGRLPTVGEDSRHWKWKSSGNYSVKSAFQKSSVRDHSVTAHSSTQDHVVGDKAVRDHSVTTHSSAHLHVVGDKASLFRQFEKKTGQFDYC